jgi:hypothetical protein
VAERHAADWWERAVNDAIGIQVVQVEEELRDRFDELLDQARQSDPDRGEVP